MYEFLFVNNTDPVFPLPRKISLSQIPSGTLDPQLSPLSVPLSYLFILFLQELLNNSRLDSAGKRHT